LTAATSVEDVLDEDATANGPEAGRASGLIFALAVVRPPRRPTLAWANAEFIVAWLGPGRFPGSGIATVALGVAGVGFAAVGLGTLSGRLRGNGTVVAATAVVATKAVAAIKARTGIKRVLTGRDPLALDFVPDSDVPRSPARSVRLMHAVRQTIGLRSMRSDEKRCNSAKKVS
jgi:hypothetical protein